MEPEYDKHLCVQCGRTIIGLDNYVSHRQQKCFKINQTIDSPLLSEGSEILTCVEARIKEDLQEASFSSPDIDKLSADDFFLSLNLQSIANTSSGNHRTLGNTADGFCAKLCFPSLENDLDATFSEDKEFLPDAIISENSNINIDSLMVPNQNFCQTNNFPLDLSHSIFSEKYDNNFCSESSGRMFQKNKYGKIRKIRKKSNSSFIPPQKPRTSIRQANNKSSSDSCCRMTTKKFTCPCCEFKCIFSSTLLNHLVTCKTRYSDADRWSTEMHKYELMFAKNSHFNCNLCSFHSNDNITFLDHLKDGAHCQKAAELKQPLICLPCDVECSGSDDMKSHFLKYHFQSQNVLHPVIVNVRKKNLHCCYCLEVTRGCDYLLQFFDHSFNLPAEDVKFIKTSMKIVSECAYGVVKSLLNPYLELFNAISNKGNFELKSVNSSIQNSVEQGENLIISSLKTSKDKLKSSVEKLMGKRKLKRKLLSNKSTELSMGSHFCCECETFHSNQESFKKRLKSHTDPVKKVPKDKKFLCEICGYSTEIFHHLTKHKRYHSGEKPFKCTDCDLSFAVCSQLLRHTRLHTGAKPYKCPYCSYVCNTQENLRKHILKTKKHAGKKMYPCKHCNFECNDFSEYKNHIVQNHSENFPDNKIINSSAVAGLYEAVQT